MHFFHILNNLCYSWFNYNYYSWSEMMSACTSVMVNDVKPILLYLLVIHISSLENVPILIMCPLFDWISCLLLLSCLNSLCHLLIGSLSNEELVNVSILSSSSVYHAFCYKEVFASVQLSLSFVCFLSFVVIC